MDENSVMPTADLNPIGVVVVNYAASDLLAANLGGLALADAEVIVVDNWSSAAERAAVTALAEANGWHLVPMTDNRGFGPGVNAGAEVALELGCAVVLLLNPDVQVTPETVAALRSASLDQPYALISPTLVDLTGAVNFAGSVLDLTDGRNRGARAARPTQHPTMFWLTAACLAVPAEVWRRTGGFDEHYFMYWEDVDFNYLARAAGAELVLRSDLTAVHDQGGTQGPRHGRAKSALYYFYNCRNRLRFAVRHLPRRTVLGWLLRTPRVSWEILLRGGRRQLVDRPGLGLAAVRGTVAGMAGAAAFLLRPSARPTRPAPAAVPPVSPGAAAASGDDGATRGP